MEETATLATMEKTTILANFLILKDFQKEYQRHIPSLKGGFSIFTPLKTLEEFHLPNFENKQAPIMVSFINLEKGWRKEKLINFDPNVFKGEIKNFNAVIVRFNQTVKLLKTWETIDNQKKLLNELHRLSFGDQKEPLFPNMEPLNLEKVKVKTPISLKYFEMANLGELETSNSELNIGKIKLSKEHWIKPINWEQQTLQAESNNEKIEIFKSLKTRRMKSIFFNLWSEEKISFHCQLMPRFDSKKNSPFDKFFASIFLRFKRGKEILLTNLENSLKSEKELCME